MKIKTILIIVITALITIILMKNTDSVEFWIFGTYSIQKLIILGIMFLLGIVVGFSLRRSGKKKLSDIHEEDREYLDMNRIPPVQNNDLYANPTSEKPLSDEDENYIR